MNARENLLAVLRHEQSEWIPLITHTDPYNRPSPDGTPEPLHAILSHVRWGDGSTIDLAEYLGIEQSDWTPGPVRWKNARCSEEWKRDGNEMRRIVHTPLGDLIEVTRFTDGDALSYKTRHLVEEPQDIPRFAAYLEDQTPSVDEKTLELIAERHARIGANGICPMPVSGTPLGMMVRIHSGPAAVTYLLADAEDEMRALFTIMERQHRMEAELVLAHTRCEALIGMDDTSTTTISPRMFEDHCVDYTNRMADLVHAAGPDRFYWHHSCGLIKDLLPIYRTTRMDLVHAYTLPPVGNVWLDEGVRAFGGRIGIFPCLPTTEEPSMPWEERERQIAEFFRQAGDGDHLIVGLTCYQHLRVADMERFRDLCRKYDPHRR